MPRGSLSFPATLVTVLFSWIVLLIIFSMLGTTSQQSMSNVFESCYVTLMFFIPGFIYLYYLRDNNKYAINLVKNISLIYLVCGIFNTLLVLFYYPDASRVLASSSETSNYYSHLGAGGFGYIYAIVLVIPCIANIVISKNKNKFLYIILLILSCLLVIKSLYTIALLFMICGLVMTFFLRKNWQIFLLFVSFMIVFVFMDKQFWGALLVQISNLFSEHSMFRNKFLDASIYFLLGTFGRSSEDRIMRYAQSINAIRLSPIFGELTSGVFGGGHTSWLDLYASYGVFSILPIGAQVILQRSILKCIDVNSKRIYAYQIILFWVLGVVNPIHLQSAVGYVMYLLTPSLLSNNTKNVEINSNKI